MKRLLIAAFISLGSFIAMPALAQVCSCPCAEPPAAISPVATSDVENPVAAGAAGSSAAIASVATTDQAAAEPVSPAAPAVSWPAIIFNEIYADPPGADATVEYVELKNVGSSNAALDGWKIVDGKNRVYIFGALSLAGNGTYVLKSATSGIPLVNSGGLLVLLRPDGTEADLQTYGTTPKEGWSWSRQSDGTWVWTLPTEDAENAPPQTPATPISSAVIAVIAASEPTVIVTSCNGTAADNMIRISEVFPRPAKGGDEWIELHNTAQNPADISGWLLDDSEGGSAPYPLPCGTILAAGGYMTVAKSASKIALNDDADEARLLKPDSAVIDRIPYRTARLGESYALAEDGWRWSPTPTPGADNVWPVVAPIGPVPPATSDVTAVPIVSAASVSGSDEILTGTVTLGTGIIGPHSFVMLDSAGDALFVKSPDAIALTGQRVSVEGKRRQYSRRTWLTAASVRMEGTTHAIAYAEDTPQGLDDSSDGMPIALAGLVESVSGNSFRISEAAGEATVRVRLPPGTVTAGLKRGSRVLTRGVVRWQGNDAELLLSSPKNITVLGPAPDENSAVATMATAAPDDNTASATSAPKLSPPLIPRFAAPAKDATWTAIVSFILLAIGGVALVIWRRRKLQEMEIVQE